MFKREFVIYLLIIAIGFVIGIIYYKRNRQLRPIVILLGVTLVSEIVSRVLAYQIRNSNPAYHFFTPIQILLWGVFFLMVIKNQKIKTAIFLFSATLVLFSMINTFFWQGLKIFPENVLRMETIFLIFCSICLFIEMLDRPSGENIFKNPFFIVAIGVLWFNLVSFIFFESHNFFLKNKIPAHSIRTIHYISNYVYYLIILAAILLSKQFYSVERKYQ